MIMPVKQFMLTLMLKLATNNYYLQLNSKNFSPIKYYKFNIKIKIIS